MAAFQHPGIVYDRCVEAHYRQHPCVVFGRRQGQMAPHSFLGVFPASGVSLKPRGYQGHGVRHPGPHVKHAKHPSQVVTRPWRVPPDRVRSELGFHEIRKQQRRQSVPSRTQTPDPTVLAPPNQTEQPGTVAKERMKGVLKARERLRRRQSSTDELRLSESERVDKAAAVTAARKLAEERVRQALQEKREMQEMQEQLQQQEAEANKAKRADRNKSWYLGRVNGGSLLNTIRKARGHTLVPVAANDSTPQAFFYFRWAEIEENLDWESFDGSKQLYNYIRGTRNLTNKNLLVKTLDAYRAAHPEADLSWVPHTFRLEEPDHKSKLLQQLQGEEDELPVYIVKPAGRNKGNGIAVHPGVELKELMTTGQIPDDFVVQTYITNPLLLNGVKFDIRMYILVATTEPFTAFWFPEGYLRLSLVDYASADISDRQAHLTNVAVQRKDPAFADKCENSIWSFAQLQQYLTDHKLAPPDFVEGNLRDQMEQCCRTLVLAVQGECERGMGCFQLMGVDLLICEDLKIHLLEVNRNPDLSVHTSILKKVIPPVLDEIVSITMDVHSKQQQGQPLFPIQTSKAVLLWQADDSESKSRHPN